MSRKWLEANCGTARLPQVMGRFFLGVSFQSGRRITLSLVAIQPRGYSAAIAATISAWNPDRPPQLRPLRASAGAQVPASARLVSMVPWFMAKTAVVPKKKRGPPPTGKGVQVGERWHPSELAAIDAWIASSSDKTITRAHAIRRLVALGLKAKAK